MNLNIVYNFTCVFGLMICIWFFVYLFYKKTYSYGLEKIGKELMKWFIKNQTNKKHVNNQFFKAGTFLSERNAFTGTERTSGEEQRCDERLKTA